MLKKLNNKKGFTLMEMLIVVAIIAVLVAIAIPVFNGALTKSKEAADVANIRAAYAEWQVKMLTENEAVPTDKTALMTSDGTETKLNYNDKLTYTPAQDNKSATIVYKATKLTNPATDDGTYTWKLGTATIN
ncbi:MAG: prepilin-type N-terminal cleavage/methylation domain-containing protein [Oscillospiraceae bacterium]|jgi:prepilin-type N-terminal cleavage/methylation domain-containing protein